MTINFSFQDCYSITENSKKQFQEFKDYYAAGGSKKLIIDMEATHAGIPLNNPRFYIPSRMRDGTPTIQVGETPMKILKHHDTNSDPIGKALYREYIDTIPEDLVGNSDVMTLLSDAASMKTQLRAMRNLKRNGILDREGYKGLGYIRLQAEVSDEKSVKQLEDGLFDAISTNFDSHGEVYCSICGTNVAKDGFCEHEMGEAYFADGMEEEGDMQFVCQYIPGKHNYKEASLINFKGDQFASIKIVDTKNKDNDKTVYMSTDSVESGHLTFKFKDSVEEDNNMKINGKEVTLSDTEQKVFDLIKVLKADAKDEDIFSMTKEIVKLKDSDVFIADVKEAELDEDVALQYAIDEVCSKDKEINSDEICEEMRKELATMKEEGIISEEDLTAADAKLSSEGRKKLPESVFCGPNRSFPVPDCAHVTAARRLIGRYKGPGSKASILACVSKKAKSLGCDSKEDNLDKQKDDGNVSILPCDCDSLKAMDTEDLRTLWHKTELELIGRKQTIVRPCSDCAVKDKENEVAKKELGEIRDSLAKAENIVSVLRGELKRAYADYEAQVDEYIKLGAQINSDKVEKLALIGVLTQRYDTLEDAVTSLKDCDLSKEETAMMDSFDIKEASIKINDGMARKPKGTIDNPAVITDGDNKQLPEGLSAPALEAIENIKDYLKSGRIGQARQLYGTMKSFGLFGNDLTFESLSVDSEDTTD